MTFFLLIRYFLIFLFVAQFSLLNSNELPTGPSFGILTVPKSGTHLLMKCLGFLQTRNYVILRQHLNVLGLNNYNYLGDLKTLDNELDRLLDTHCYFYEHAHFSGVMERFMKRHPEFPLIITIRDLRDVIISQAYFVWDRLEKTLGPTTIDQKITYLLEFNRSKPPSSIPYIHSHAEAILRFFDKPNVLVVHFEDLVGSKGGGDDVIQKEMIQKIADHIGVPLSSEKLEYIQANLFGQTTSSDGSLQTFRSGQIGSWKNTLTAEHLKTFNQVFGQVQKAFGYSKK